MLVASWLSIASNLEQLSGRDTPIRCRKSGIKGLCKFCVYWGFFFFFFLLTKTCSRYEELRVKEAALLEDEKIVLAQKSDLKLRKRAKTSAGNKTEVRKKKKSRCVLFCFCFCF